MNLGDGSVLTYYWYRFADQPALLRASLSKSEREVLQKRDDDLLGVVDAGNRGLQQCSKTLPRVFYVDVNQVTRNECYI